MQINEYVVITILIVIIIILIFSNITVSMGESENKQIDVSRVNNILPTPSITRSVSYLNHNIETQDLLSNDVKKQLNILENQFYLNTCKK
jgi:hypothetical protein